jgi:hypothetical protein
MRYHPPEMPQPDWVGFWLALFCFLAWCLFAWRAFC